MKRTVAVVASLVGVALMGGCIGPIGYLYTVENKARRAVAKAETVNAEELSPYEYWSAVTYLEMAREKAAQADFEDANKYGSKAVEMGEEANRIAGEKAADGPNAAKKQPSPPVEVEPESESDQ